jgi:hypothetical protein
MRHKIDQVREAMATLVRRRFEVGLLLCRLSVAGAITAVIVQFSGLFGALLNGLNYDPHDPCGGESTYLQRGVGVLDGTNRLVMSRETYLVAAASPSSTMPDECELYMRDEAQTRLAPELHFPQD